MAVPWVLLLVIFPAFWLLGHGCTGLALYACCAVPAVAATLATGTVLVAVTESLPARVRSGGLVMICAVVIPVFGGSTRFVIAWLTRLTGNLLAPARYMSGAVVMGLVAITRMPEVAPVRRVRPSGSGPLAQDKKQGSALP